MPGFEEAEEGLQRREFARPSRVDIPRRRGLGQKRPEITRYQPAQRAYPRRLTGMLTYKNEKRPHIAGVGLNGFCPGPALGTEPGAELTA